METKDIKTSSESSGASEAVAKPAKKSPPKWLLVAACLSFAPLTNTAGLIMPVLGTMQQSFAASGAVYPDWLVQCIQTSLMLSAFIMGLLFGPASKRFSLKTLGVAGIAITMVCNVVPGIFPQGGLWLFVIMRFLSGFGVGLVYGCNTSCIVANFPPAQRAGLIAASVAVMQASSIVYSFAAGYLGAIDWRLNFIAMSIFVIPMILVIVGMPSKSELEVKESGKKQKVKLSGQCWFVIVMALLYMLIAGSFNLGVSQQLIALGIGGPVEAGQALAVSAVAGLLISLVWAKLRSLFGRWSLLAVVILGVIGYVVASMTTSLVVVYVAAALIGAQCGAGMAEVNTSISETAGAAATPTAIGIYNGLSRLFGFFLSMILALIQVVFGFVGPNAFMMASLPIWAVLVVFGIIYAVKVYKKPEMVD